MSGNHENSKPMNLAVLIDSDNTSHRHLKILLDEVAKYGTATIRRAYADWTSAQMTPWKEKLQEYAVQPIQQFRNVESKNCTDSSLIIDSMDILYKETVDGIVIVSSDSDYTRLAMRFREEGMFVMGIGKKQTPRPFIRACEYFVYIENLGKNPEEQKATHEGIGVKGRNIEEARKIIEDAYEKFSEDNNEVLLSRIGSMLRNLNSDFDPRNYGYSQLQKMVEAIGTFEIIKKKGHQYIRKRSETNL